MRSDQNHPGRTPRSNSSIPVPGMPYGMHADTGRGPSDKQGIEFIESGSMAGQHAAGNTYNPWKDQGWDRPEPDPPMEAETDGEDTHGQPYQQPYYAGIFDSPGAFTAQYRPYGADNPQPAYGAYQSDETQPIYASYEPNEPRPVYGSYTPNEPAAYGTYEPNEPQPAYEPFEPNEPGGRTGAWEPYEAYAPYQEYPQNVPDPGFTAPYPPSQSTGAYPPADAYSDGGYEEAAEPYPDAAAYDEPADFFPEPPSYGDETQSFSSSDLQPEQADYPESGDNNPPPPPQPKKRLFNMEPWRMVVILSCVAGLLFCGLEIYKIASNVMESEAELSNYRDLYLRENNVELSRRAQAVALRPAGETYPPRVTQAPVQTPTPTPRIEQNDPLIAAMSDGGLNAGQTVAPYGPTPEPRTRLERYPLNPLLVERDDITTLQAQNEDIVGRLIIDGILNEIVVQRNNTYYLNHNAMGLTSNYSAVFADESLSFRTPPENILLYGRTSYEGKAFSQLKNYVSQGVSFAQRYAFLSFNHLYEETRYVTVAIVQADSNPASQNYFKYRQLTFESDSQMLSFVAEAKSRSIYQFNVAVAASDRLLTLVTLSDGTDTDNLIILCRMLRDGERDGVVQTQ